jgi:glycosyltransferase involved in cell wall biosynthesis
MGIRVAILWSGLSGYVNACFRELANHPQLDALFLCHYPTDPQAPFDESAYEWVDQRALYDDLMAAGSLTATVAAFAPDVVLVTSWHVKGYRAALKALEGKAVRVVCMDNPWVGTLRQYLGVAVSRWYIHPLYERAFVPGDRQAEFARRLGFRQSAISEGMLACDPARFAPPPGAPPGRGFVYVGRLSPEKGLDTLADAYRRYRTRTDDPWPLAIYGAGPLSNTLAAIDGVTLGGFIQPADLPAALHAAGAFVLPSRIFEHWGVAIQEAGAAGLPLIVTSLCGASAHLVQDNLNGAVVEAGDPEDLARALLRIAGLTPEKRAAYSAMSLALAQQFTPQRWAGTVIEMPQRSRRDVAG